MTKYLINPAPKHPLHGSLWNLHSHSRFSAGDALPTPAAMVERVVKYEQPALGITDHGNMAASVQLYRAARKAGILPFPGSELYVVHDRDDKKAKRHHMCVAAFTTEGYLNLVKLSSLTFQNFHHKPLIDHKDLALLSEQGGLKGIAATSGCYFSMTSQSVVRGDEAAARALLSSYATWFDKFFVELQNHGIDHGDGWTDDLLADTLLGLADDLGLPCVVTQDAHYCDAHDKEVHDALKRIVAFGPDADDAVFPGDGFHLADDRWFDAHHRTERLERGAAGLKDLLDSHELKIPELDSYSYNIPFTVADPDGDLRTRCEQQLEALGSPTRAYTERLDAELEIIQATGMAGYLVLVAEVTDWCRESKIFTQARGSASGSLVCYLMQITNEDPIKWGLRFDRFISRDRTKPPDIDLDVESTRRGDLMDWLASRFAVHQIGTWTSFSLGGENEDGVTSGSLRVRYYSRRKAMGESAPNWYDVPAEDKRMLYKISDAKAYSAYGTHAAGLVITTNDDEFDRLVPTMYIASSKTTVTQYPMDDIEALGLVKLDILGLKTLAVLHQTMDNLGRDVFEGLGWIPLGDKQTYSQITKGNTEGVFQLEGYAAKKGCKELKPTHIRDVVAAMALFRPATMESGATRSYIHRKHGDERVPSRHSIIEKHTTLTYGIMLYQEQVIAILRELGLEPDDLTAFLKAVKASNENIGSAGAVIAGYRSMVQQMATDAGMDDADWHWLWGAIEGFSKYGFNQAHSTAYGLTAYRCAYLSAHHPKEFFAALLSIAASSNTKKDRITGYLRAVRNKDIRILPPHVNHSDLSFAVDERGIRKGLVSIDKVGAKAAEEIVSNRPEQGYGDLEELCSLVNHRKVTGVKAYRTTQDLHVGTVGHLYEAGALEGLVGDAP